MEVGDKELGTGWGVPLCSTPHNSAGLCCAPRYDLQIRYLPEDYMERFLEDRTTLLYFYQQVLHSPFPFAGLHLFPSL